VFVWNDGLLTWEVLYRKQEVEDAQEIYQSMVRHRERWGMQQSTPPTPNPPAAEDEAWRKRLPPNEQQEGSKS
jgi:hypothetical protein